VLYKEVDKAGACHLYPLKDTVGQINVGKQGLSDHLGCLAEGSGIDHSGIGRKISVGGIGGNLDYKGHQLCFGQLSLGKGGGKARMDQRAKLLLCLFYSIKHVYTPLFDHPMMKSPSKWAEIILKMRFFPLFIDRMQ